jgi:hypothetical protein
MQYHALDGLICASFAWSMLSFTGTRGVGVESVVPTSSLSGAIGAHCAIAIIPTRTGEDVSYRIVSTGLKARKGRGGSGNELRGDGRGIGAGSEFKRLGEVCSLFISLACQTGLYRGGHTITWSGEQVGAVELPWEGRRAVGGGVEEEQEQAPSRYSDIVLLTSTTVEQYVYISVWIKNTEGYLQHSPKRRWYYCQKRGQRDHNILRRWMLMPYRRGLA